jgi:hypothetical protein
MEFLTGLDGVWSLNGANMIIEIDFGGNNGFNAVGDQTRELP